ncbi:MULTISPECIES: carboxyltransferase domain-containing protein [unclassified Streptomyces]|uniref:carboxyltransferase domain-containing protein n=1 Tax=unclassified Streptomyces TaxID=2593676 RepID=UPI002DDC77BF|nr:carboxyltransferase domain-containing protein [Streptomyces sp. NBC_01795]WSA90636.1 carboxyltransferase domain-containing protein [Streptomyces sp. NBC_01795]WSS45576.1 carboxyltransferase domain-containing protein [Streptomyces sp. NBC_01187]
MTTATSPNTDRISTFTTEPYGDAAVMVHAHHPDPAARRSLAHRLRTALLDDLPYGAHDVVSGFESVLVEFDCTLTAHPHVEQAVRAALRTLPTKARAGGLLFEIPGVFGGEYGPALTDVAAEHGLTEQAVVDAYTTHPLTIDLLGTAMSPMMHGADLGGETTRRAEPRTRVERGSLPLAGPNALLYPVTGPTGRRVIGPAPRSASSRSPATRRSPTAPATASGSCASRQLTGTHGPTDP